MTRVEMRLGEGIVEHILLRPDSTSTVRALLSALPFASTVHRWGDEIYFQAPFHRDLESDARAEMSVGDVAYWPDGDAIAIFFGPTPVSRGQRPRAYSACNIVGRTPAEAHVLRSVDDGAKVELRKTKL